MEENLWHKFSLEHTVEWSKENIIFGCRGNVREICEKNSTPIQLGQCGDLNELASIVLGI